jgi:hypothetical protein
MKKKDQNLFVAQARVMFERMGAEALAGEASAWRFASALGPGPLTCTVFAENEPWIAGQFADVAKAKRHFGVVSFGSGPNFNPHSGKWNFHPHQESSGEALVAYARELLKFVELPEAAHDFEEEKAGTTTARSGLVHGGNTRVSYQYRDADNYKVGRDVVFSGEISPWDLKLIALCLDEGEYFIPGAVGLADLQDSFGAASRWDPERDHPYHEITGIELTDDEPTDELVRSIGEFANHMADHGLLGLASKSGWDDAYKPSFYPEMRDRHRAHVKSQRSR